MPNPIRRLLRRCPQKDRRERLADIADARLEVQDALRDSPEEIARNGTTAREPRRRIGLSLALAATALVAVGRCVDDANGFSGASRPRATSAFPPGDVTIAPGTVPEISPDGRAIAFAGFGADGISRVFVRVLDSPAYGRWPAPRESETG